MPKGKQARIISENLKRLMNDYDINQADLAKIAGVSESAVGKWILMHNTLTMENVQKIADHFGLKKADIMDEPDNPKMSYKTYKRLNEAIKKLNQDEQNKVVDFVEKLTQNCVYKADTCDSKMDESLPGRKDENKESVSKEAFGRRLKIAREAAELTQEELARKIGTSKSMISMYESGNSDARQSIIPKLAKALRTTTSWLILGVQSEFDLLDEPIKETVDFMQQLKGAEQMEIRNYAEFISSKSNKFIRLRDPESAQFVAKRSIKDDAPDEFIKQQKEDGKKRQ